MAPAVPRSDARGPGRKGKCVGRGYIYALNNDLRFLTGDKEFEDLPNVAFVQ